METRRYFEDLNVGDKLKFHTRVSREQVERFLDSVGGEYRRHIENAVERYGNLVPPHLIPGIIVNATINVKAYPTLALVEMSYRFYRPVHIDEELQIIDEIISKREISLKLGEVRLSRKATCNNSLVLEASIEHRLLRR